MDGSLGVESYGDKAQAFSSLGWPKRLAGFARHPVSGLQPGKKEAKAGRERAGAAAKQRSSTSDENDATCPHPAKPHTRAHAHTVLGAVDYARIESMYSVPSTSIRHEPKYSTHPYAMNPRCVRIAPCGVLFNSSTTTTTTTTQGASTLTHTLTLSHYSPNQKVQPPVRR